MALAARDPWYQNGRSVDGSLAYDLDWAVRERELTHAGELPRRQEKEQVKVHEKPKVQVRERQHISPFTVLATMAAIGMAVLLQNRALYPRGLVSLGEQVLWQVLHGAASFLLALGLMLLLTQ